MSSQKLSERLKAQHGGTLHSDSGGFGEIPLDEIEDESADVGEEFSVVAEEHSQAFG